MPPIRRLWDAKTSKVAVAGRAIAFDLDAGGEELVGGETLGEPFTAEQACRCAGPGERVRGQHDRGRVPRGLFLGVQLTVGVELGAFEMRSGPVAAALGAQEL